MSKTTELLDAAKEKLGLTSNYQLAAKLQISQSDIAYAYKDKWRADEYTATKLALALGLEPIHVIAELRAADEKNETKRAFWVAFLTRAASVVACLSVLMLGWPPSSEAGTLRVFASPGHEHKGKLCVIAIIAWTACRRWLTGFGPAWISQAWTTA